MTAVPDAAQRAVALLGSMAEHDWPAVSAGFNATLAGSLDDAALDRAWTQIGAQMGDYLGMGEPEVTVAGGRTDVTVPMHFESGPVHGQVSFDGTSAVSGVHFLFGGQGSVATATAAPDLFLRCADGHLYLASRSTLRWATIHFGAKQLRPCPVDGRWRLAEFVDPATLSRAELDQAAAHRI
jgi:hypothetical protein